MMVMVMMMMIKGRAYDDVDDDKALHGMVNNSVKNAS